MTSKEFMGCEHCSECIYVCEGDFFCDIKHMLVIEDFNPIISECEDYNE